MAGREFQFVTGNYYHLYNRGVARQPIFSTITDYRRALTTLTYYKFQQPPFKLSRLNKLSQEKRNQLLSDLASSGHQLIDLVCFSFMPNHVHFLAKQNIDDGISEFMSKFSNSYSKYFNTKNRRIGPIFQGVFQAVPVTSNNQLLHLSRYIHINPVVSGVIKKSELAAYPWTSVPYYQNNFGHLVDPQIVLSYFPNFLKYHDFLNSQIDYGERLEEIKHLLLEIP